MSQTYTLYHFSACPFCVRVRRFLEAESINIMQKDTRLDSTACEELQQGGGKTQVPCLKIEDNGQIQWMYESDDIIEYFRKQAA